MHASMAGSQKIQPAVIWVLTGAVFGEGELGVESMITGAMNVERTKLQKASILDVAERSRGKRFGAVGLLRSTVGKSPPTLRVAIRHGEGYANTGVTWTSRPFGANGATQPRYEPPISGATADNAMSVPLHELQTKFSCVSRDH